MADQSHSGSPAYENLWLLKAKLQELRELRLERLRSKSTGSVDNTTTILLTKEAA